MIQLGGVHVVPVVNLLHELMLSDPLIHFDETRLQVLKSNKAPTADHWIWVRASGPPGRRIVLFDYDASRAGAVPRRLLDGYRGILVTDGYEAYEAVARTLKAHSRGVLRTRASQVRGGAQGAAFGKQHAKIALSFIRELYLIERALWDKDQPITADHRVRVRAELSAPTVERFHAWLMTLSPQVVPKSLLGKAVHYALGQWPKLTTFLTHGEVPLDNNRCENAIRPFVAGRNYPRSVVREGFKRRVDRDVLFLSPASVACH